jgi:hypothetical protein
VNLYDFYQQIQDGMTEHHWTFDYPNDELEMIQKEAATCQTRHSISQAEVLRYWLEIINNMDAEAIVKLHEGSNRLKKHPNDFINDLKNYLTEIENKYPERLI